MSSAAAVGLVVGVAQHRQQRKANRANEKASRAQQRAADIENARSRRRNVVASRIARARTIAEGVNSGFSAGGSSAVTGAAGSAVSQGASANAFSRNLQVLDKQRFSALDNANSALTRANTFQAVGNVAQSFLQPQA